VHGVVDLYGNRKPSFGALRRISSPVGELGFERDGDRFVLGVTARNSIPAYTLRGYKVRWVAYGFGDLPMEQHDDLLPTLEPGARADVSRTFTVKELRRLRVEIVRPTGFSAADAEWRA
jgi:beta-glucuronidase